MVRIACPSSFLQRKDDRLNLLQKSLKNRGERYWEIYIILLIAGILRLYRLDTFELSTYHLFLFRLFFDSVPYCLIPATSNGSSIHLVYTPLAPSISLPPA